MRTSNYNFDIDKHSLIKPVVIIRSGDHDIDTIKITLSNQGDPVDLTKATVTFMGTTPAGNKIIDDAHVKIVDATTGIFEYTFPSAAGASVGEYQDAYFSIILGNGQTSTMNFRIQVLSGVDISAPAASEYITHYDTMVTALNSAYDSATHETNEKMASTVSSLATSAATVLDSALARVNDIDSTANNASSAASNAVSMASSVASTVTSQASYINSVASSAASNVSSVAAGVVDKLNNISVGGRNYILSSKRTLAGSGSLQDIGWVYSSMPISTFSNKKITVSVQVDYDNVTSLDGPSRMGFEVATNQKNADGTTGIKDIGTWRFPSVGDSFHGRIYSTFDLSNINLESKDTSNPNLWINGMFIQGVTGTSVSISNPKIEIGNIATDWTPAPEDVDNKLSTRNATFTDFNDVARNMVKYSGSWVIADQSIANSPLPNYYTAKITPGFSGGTDGYIELVPFASGSAKKYIAVVGSGMLSAWKSFAFDDDVVHKTGNETIAGDKTLAGKVTATNIVETGAPLSVSTTTTFNGLTFSFTRVGSSVYVTTGTTAVTTAIQPGWYNGIIPAGYRTIASVEMAYFQKPSSGGFVSTSPSGRGYFNAALVVGDKPRIVAYYPTTDPWPAN